MQFPHMHIAYCIIILFSLVLLDTFGYIVKVCTDNIPSARNVNNASLQCVLCIVYCVCN